MFNTLRRHPLLVLNRIVLDPLDAFAALQENLYSRVEAANTTQYKVDLDWEVALHRSLGMQSEAVIDGFWPLWRGVIAELGQQGVTVGPFSFHEWNDGDAGFVRAIWSLVRHLRPEVVVETGVAHGMTSRFILEAMERNDAGRLWSIDLPPVNPVTRQEVGIAARQSGVKRERWRYIEGTSRRRLLPLVERLGQIDLFIHDSMHSFRNVMFELETVWDYLRPGGVIIVDDIDANAAFQTFSLRFREHTSLICTAEPLRPDMRRFNQKGLFGIICKRGNDEVGYSSED
jgi:hypothetical protein